MKLSQCITMSQIIFNATPNYFIKYFNPDIRWEAWPFDAPEPYVFLVARERFGLQHRWKLIPKPAFNPKTTIFFNPAFLGVV